MMKQPPMTPDEKTELDLAYRKGIAIGTLAMIAIPVSAIHYTLAMETIRAIGAILRGQ